MKNDTPCYDLIGEQTHCFSCKDALKKAVTCEFCAMSYCNDCRMRSRDFPNSIILQNGDKIYGKICKICDRKFIKLDQYKRKVMPMSTRDEDLRHMVQGYEMKLNKAQYAISEEARLSEELTQKQNESNLQKRKVQASSTLHEDSIRRGVALLSDIDQDIRV